jgi:hypothetical protein
MGDRVIATAISDAVHELEKELGLPDDSLLSGTSILFEDSSFEEENQVRDRLVNYWYTILISVLFPFLAYDREALDASILDIIPKLRRSSFDVPQSLADGFY